MNHGPLFNFHIMPILRALRSFAAIHMESLRGYPRQKRKFLEKHGYPLNLKHPKSFNEKIIWKKIHDRNPLLPIVADKYRVREYIQRCLGAEEAQRILIPLYHVSKSPDDIPFNKLPPSYVAKANHGSGWNILVRDENKRPEEIVKACAKWLSNSYSGLKYEWGYQHIPPRVVFEEYLTDETGKVPKDYKFFMIHGVCRMIQVDSDRFDGHTRSLYNSDWEKLDVGYKFPEGPKIQRPDSLNRMLKLAQQLSTNFDFVRVDLYAIGERIFFGEMTHYPESGMGKFTPMDFDYKLGEHWSIPGKARS